MAFYNKELGNDSKFALLRKKHLKCAVLLCGFELCYVIAKKLLKFVSFCKRRIFSLNFKYYYLIQLYKLYK